MKNYKIIFIVLFSVMLLSTCKKNQVTEIVNESGEEIFTDSFSPSLWENPNSANKIDVSDMDLGKIIKEDVIDPKLRKILTIVKNFNKDILANNKTDIQKILTASSYNSFNLRYKELNFKSDQKYSIRVGYPEELQVEPDINNNQNNYIPDNNSGQLPDKNKQFPPISDRKNFPPESQDLTSYDKTPFWISFKILISDKKSVIGKVELTLVNDEYIISDFDEDLYTKLNDLLNKIKS